MAEIIKRAFVQIFKRKKAPPLACYHSLDEEEAVTLMHTAACFIDLQPLALAELFTSQGCAASPAALLGIHEAVNADPNVRLLTYDVTYFDRLGHKDPFADLRWDNRQKAYARKWGRPNLYTPMVVVDGVADGGSGGGTKAEIEGIVTRAREAITEIKTKCNNKGGVMICNMLHGEGGVERGTQEGMGTDADWHILLDANDTAVRIDTDRARVWPPHDILLITYDGKTEKVKIPSGLEQGEEDRSKQCCQRHREARRVDWW
ncbi:thioredoxin-like protein [Xylariaceae sp. FL0255]|nr:thioredoxin-like protein [Xylariaceae sp. FL0255]